MTGRDEDAPEAEVRQGRTVQGTVKAVLPRALYRVAIDGGAAVTAHATAGPDRNFVRLVVGDVVTVALSERDLGRGRIVRRGAMGGKRIRGSHERAND
jgi:translation initiation factor IF-1